MGTPFLSLVVLRRQHGVLMELTGQVMQDIVNLMEYVNGRTDSTLRAGRWGLAVLVCASAGVSRRRTEKALRRSIRIMGPWFVGSLGAERPLNGLHSSAATGG